MSFVGVTFAIIVGWCLLRRRKKKKLKAQRARDLEMRRGGSAGQVVEGEGVIQNGERQDMQDGSIGGEESSEQGRQPKRKLRPGDDDPLAGMT